MSEDSDIGQSLEEINDSFYSTGATDGLPIIPPTEDRLEEMLTGTDLPPDHVIGRLGNEELPLSVEKLATNAIMAGCLPTHMPVLVAGAEALVDPASNSMSFSVSTTGWAYMWTVNGPVRNDIDIQCRSGAYGPGFRPNRVIGRALGLAYKNTAKIHPGEKDMATFGNPFKFSLLAGENEEQSPWEPYHVSEGYSEDESTITLAGPSCFITWTPYRNEATYILEGMIDHMDPYMTAAGKHTVWHLICPYSAERLGNAGLSKADIQNYVRENSYVPRSKYARGKYQDRYVDRIDGGDIPSRQLSQAPDPENLKILSLGGAGTVNVIIGPSIGGPVTKRIEFPDNWDELTERYRTERKWVTARTFYDR